MKLPSQVRISSASACADSMERFAISARMGICRPCIFTDFTPATKLAPRVPPAWNPVNNTACRHTACRYDDLRHRVFIKRFRFLRFSYVGRDVARRLALFGSQPVFLHVAAENLAGADSHGAVQEHREVWYTFRRLEPLQMKQDRLGAADSKSRNQDGSTSGSHP